MRQRIQSTPSREMFSTPKRIAIIGAGLAGAGTTKSCIEQGLDVVVFEKTNYTFGLWRYQENIDENGVASVMKSTVINTSKEVSSISDFPPPDHFPNYMHNTKNVSTRDDYFYLVQVFLFLFK